MMATVASSIQLDKGKRRTGPRLMKLEALRGFAALYIVFAHFANVILHRPSWVLPLRFGTEAVGLFFVLSGFVIYYSTFGESKELLAGDYFVKRTRRIYPLFLCSLVMSYAFISLAGRALLPLDLRNLVGNVLMLQDTEGGHPGVWFNSYYNPVYWSLSYEWWFYILFFAVNRRITDTKKQQFVVAAGALLGFALTMTFPNQPALFLKAFMSWWCGVELAREYCESGMVTWKGQRTTIGLLALMTAASLVPVFIDLFHHRPILFGGYPFNDFRLISSSLWFVLAGVLWRRIGFVGFSWTFGWFAAVAPISYGIYIFHYPILVLIDSRWPGFPRVAELLAILAVTFLVAYLFEVRIQRLINRWTRVHLLSPSDGDRRKAAPMNRGPQFR
ncbi:MAG TPA: acyltransferase [Humisphaera sp.]|nr:acyltransferase [Humisphaera sp.]